LRLCHRAWFGATLAGWSLHFLGFLLAGLVVKLIGSLPFLGPLFEDTSGRSDIHLAVSWSALIISISILMVVGIIAGMIPAVRAARLNPVDAIRNG
jgi:putative ABC transport system permease protein